MHIETITLERVFDVQRRKASRYAAQRTDFSFQSNGVRRFAVQAPGWPSIEAGATLTVVLGQTGRWKTLGGWINHATGEVVLPETGRSISGALQSFVLAMLAVAGCVRAGTPLGRAALGGAAALLVLLSVRLVAQWRRKRALSKAILGLAAKGEGGREDG